MEALGREDRREVVRLLKADREHPDPEVRAVAYGWAHSPRWDGWAYRLPGWFLPWVGLVMLLVGVQLGGQPVLVVLGVAITVWGAIRWNNLACARAIRRVYRKP